MNERVVRVEDGSWRIRGDQFRLIDQNEQEELRKFCDQEGIPYELDEWGVGIHGSVLWEEIDAALTKFYQGTVAIYPF